jgi:hypothetical protein
MNDSGRTNECRRYRELVEDHLAGRLSAVDAEDLREHCATCAVCAADLALHDELAARGDRVPLPDREAFAGMRERVLGKTEAYEPRSAPSGGFLADLFRVWRLHPVPSGLLAAAVLAGVALLGRASAPEVSFEERLLAESAGWNGARHAGLDAYWDVPFSFSNVMVRSRDGGRLALSFDAGTHMDLVVPEDSPLARAVLAQAIVEPGPMGARFKAMQVAPRLRDDRLQQALIATVLGDPEVAVRINALAVLMEYPDDQAGREALLQVLGGDPDVQMRLMALEELKRRSVPPETLRDAARANDYEGTQAVLREVATSL